MTSQLTLLADHPGVFQGLSAQFSGDGFSDMHFDVSAVAPDAYAKWIAAAKAGTTALDSASYAQLSEQSANVKPLTYKSIDPQLFDAIVNETRRARGRA